METPQAHELLARVLLVLAIVLLLKRMLLSPPFKTSSGSSPPFPRPRGLPIIGNLHQLGALPQASLSSLAAEHAAPLMLLRLGSVPTLVVSSAAAARAVFRRGSNDRALSGRPALRAAATLSYGLRNVSFAPPGGEFWRAARRACLSELLGAPRVRAFRAVREDEATALVAAVADESRGNGSAVNLSDRLVAATSRIVRRVAFGDDGGEDSSIRTKAILEETQRLLGAFFVADYMPWLGWLDTLRGLRRRLERNFHELDAFYEKVIDEHVHRRTTMSNNSKEEDLVDVLLRLHDDPAHRSTFGSRGAIKGILTDMFIAGTDTSSAAVEWTMTELVRNPDVLAKAQREVRGVVGDNRDAVLESDLPRLHYLKLVIRESLRLHPPVPLLVPRETTEPCTVHGYVLPAKTRVLVNAKAIGTDPDAWGPDAARFVPERHDGGDLNDHKPWHDDTFRLVPFGLGRRSCPGVHFATAVVELLLANLLLCFDWRAPHGGEVDLEEENGLTVHRKNPLVLVAERRRGAASGTSCLDPQGHDVVPGK
ncbi:unnamed protein product [Urochloa decumbens]|uniref:Uncharacterized protein n=1 Tax=Urochloa decumbens TaxID=240449 RepID=A0ABC9CWD5_9POAL